MSLNPSPPGPSPARSVPVAVFAVALLVVAGVAIVATAAYFELRPAPAPAGSVSVTDDEGRTVAVPAHPSRVVVLAPSVMDTVARLGMRPSVVGIDCGSPTEGGIEADYNGSQISLWQLDASLCVETSPAVNIPQLLNLTPDLVLASTITSLADVEELSTTFHLPTLVLQPSTVGGVAVDVSLLGRVFGVEATADQLVAQLQVALGQAQGIVTNLTNSGAPLPSLLLTYYASPAASPTPGYWTYGPGTFGQSLIDVVGASSISAGSPFPYPELSGDQVLSDNPSVIVYGTAFGVTLATYQAGPQWSSLPAVQDGRAYGMDSNLLTEPDPTMVLEALPLLLAILHPA